MTGFSDLLARSVFTLRLDLSDAAVDGGDGGPGSGGASPASTGAAAADAVPPDAAAAPDLRAGGYRAVVFHQLRPDTVNGLDLVGSRRRVTVSCCLCPSVFRFPASGYGEMARRVEAAGWHYSPGLHLHERAWCPDCRPNAGKAVD
ncbi:hypothetical protein ACFQS3_24770 [Glycomyces mayteni]|uniref:Uncharacterized protein n=1 Tax=Glycomyces mayteni TaxID=543887 RepID=A0ABW2DDR8_9ACTN|nr:hypothetical protein GCM10025732_57770 [Glycomyces mayteni]